MQISGPWTASFPSLVYRKNQKLYSSYTCISPPQRNSLIFRVNEILLPIDFAIHISTIIIEFNAKWLCIIRFRCTIEYPRVHPVDVNNRLSRILYTLNYYHYYNYYNVPSSAPIDFPYSRLIFKIGTMRINDHARRRHTRIINI